MARTNNLRKSIKGHVQANSVYFTSSLPYASIHNEGGKISVTAKMKGFFWAMFYKAFGAITKGGNNTRNQALNAEAMMWKAMALLFINKSKIQFESKSQQVIIIIIS